MGIKREWMSSGTILVSSATTGQKIVGGFSQISAPFHFVNIRTATIWNKVLRLHVAARLYSVVFFTHVFEVLEYLNNS
jgi:hypothetical protein